MKQEFCAFLLSAAGLLGAAETIYLNPSAECGGFMKSQGGWAEAQSSAVFRYDQKNLYMDAVFQLLPGKDGSRIAPVFAGKAHDSFSVFAGDVMELQLAPSAQKGVYYHFAVSPSGFAYTAKQRDISWNPEGVETEITVSDEFWKISMIIPFSALGEAAPAPGDTWRVNLGRTARHANGIRECSSWSDAYDFHKVDEYGQIVFGKPAPAEQIFLKKAEVSQGKYTFEFTAGKLPEKITAEVALPDETRKQVIDAAKKNSFTVQGELKQDYLPLKVSGNLSVTLKDGDKILFSRNGTIPGDFMEDTLSLNTFYCLEGKQLLKYSIHLPGKADLQICRDGQIILEQKDVSGDGSISMEDTKQFPAGRYVVRLIQEKKQTSRIFFILKKAPELPAVPANPVLKADGNILRRNGSPLFLLGMSTTRKSFLPFDGTFNLAYSKFGRQLNAVNCGGIPSGRYCSRQTVTGRLYQDWDKYSVNLQKYLRKINNKNAFYRIAYEAEIPTLVKDSDEKFKTQDSAPLMKKIYDFSKKERPELLFSIHTGLNRCKDFAPACDILEIASYRSSYAPCMMGYLADDMAVLRKQVGTKPVLYWLGGTIPDNRCRIAEEIRCALYMAVIYDYCGAIIHMGHGYLPEDRPRLWSLLSGVNTEIQSFYPEFRSGTPAEQFFRETPPAEIFRSVRETPKSWIAVVVNTSPSEKTVTFTPSQEVADTLLPLEGKSMKSEKGSFTETFTPYEPKVMIFQKKTR